MAQLGVYVGNSTGDVQKFETWLGREVDGVLGYVGQGSWYEFTEGARWAADDLWSKIDRPVFWSVPLIVNGANLADAAAGKYNDYYRQVARQLADTRPGDETIYVRTGWEFNANWMPWSAIGQPENFKAAFRQFVKAFEGVDSRFKFEWNVNVGNMGMNPETAYPGDDVVDIIGMDFYWQTQWDGADPVKAWDLAVNRQYGLQWLEDFADARGKPTAYSEWGVTTDNASYYVQKAREWFEAPGRDVVYQTYWDSNAAYPGKLSDGSDPRTGAAFKQAFNQPTTGGGGDGGGPPPGGGGAVVKPPAALEAGAGPDALVLRIAQDAWQGDAQYVVRVDGKQVGGTFAASAAKASGLADTLTLRGDWAAGPHTVEVQFLNDAWGGTKTTDRNLYLESATYNGAELAGDTFALMSAGTRAFTVTDAGGGGAPAPQPPPPAPGTGAVAFTVGTGSDALVLRIAQDAWQGDAQYVVRVDGRQIGGTLTAKALKASGLADTVTVKGDWGPGAHKVEVQFINDAWGGTKTTDRNLYLDGATYNGADLTGDAHTFLSAGTKSFSFTDAGGGAPAPAPAPVTVDFRAAPLTGGAGAQEAGGLDVVAKSWDGAPALAFKGEGGLGVAGGRNGHQLDHRPAGGSEALTFGFDGGVDAAKLRLAVMKTSDDGAGAEVGAWKAYDAAGAVVGQGVLDPRGAAAAGGNAWDFTIDPAADFARLEVTALPYNGGAIVGGTDSSDFAVQQITYWQDAVI